MLLIKGKKHVILVDPVESAYLYADFATTPIGTSPVNSTHVELDVHPLVKMATLHVAELGAGDVLFIPLFWWHIIKSTTDADHMHLALTLQFEPAFYTDTDRISRALGSPELEGYVSPAADYEKKLLHDFSVWRAEFQLRRERNIRSESEGLLPLLNPNAQTSTNELQEQAFSLAELERLVRNPAND